MGAQILISFYKWASQNRIITWRSKHHPDDPPCLCFRQLPSVSAESEPRWIRHARYKEMPMKCKGERNGGGQGENSDHYAGLTPGKGEREGRVVWEKLQPASQFWESCDKTDGRPWAKVAYEIKPASRMTGCFRTPDVLSHWLGEPQLHWPLSEVYWGSKEQLLRLPVSYVPCSWFLDETFE